MTTQYVARTVRPLRLDLAEGQKRVAAGTISGLQTAGKYETELIFQPRSGGNPATFRLLPAAQRRSGNVFITGREAWAEYTPHAWLLLQLRLVVPLAPAEIVQQQAKEKEALGAVLLLVGLLVLGLGWWLDIFWPMAGIYMMAVLLVLGVVRYEKRQRRP